MARVEILVIREQEAHFGLYRTSAGGDESIIVRRKVGEPTDYMHTKSRKLADQRRRLALASQHYAKLTPSQKAITRHQFAIVQYETGHSKTEEKLLVGRQLFISQDIHSLKTTGKLIVLPSELCIMLVDEEYNALEGDLTLFYKEAGEWKECEKEELAVGCWLFSQVPTGMQGYRCYGEAEHHEDPMHPELQNMTQEELKTYRYHVLETTLFKVCYTSPKTQVILSQATGIKHSQPFYPFANFTLKQLWFTMASVAGFETRYPSNALISIHQANANFKPIEPPLAEAEVSLTFTEPGEWRTFKASFAPLDLEKHRHYAWVLGLPREIDTNRYVHIRRGEAGTCNVAEWTLSYLSELEGEEWTPWIPWSYPQLHYEMRA